MADGATRAALAGAFEAARAADDAEAMADAAIRLAAIRVFGGPLTAPGYLHEAYERAGAAGLERLRVRLAVELARAWAYAGEPDRAAPYAQHAADGATRLGDLALEAAALDADLLVHWGPDDLAARLQATARLDSIAGRVTDPETRLSAALWRLTTALETLDVVTVRRQIRLLDTLAHDTGSPRIALFAASRRGMAALLDGDLPAAREHLAAVRAAADTAGEPDGEALVHVLQSAIARQAGDQDALAAEAAAYEAFGTAQGIRSVLAEASLFWLDAGQPGRARDLLDQVTAGGLAAIPRDVDWLLNVTIATEVAARTGTPGIAEEALGLLTPYTGRGVVNAGGVAFAGVVDDCLQHACLALGRGEDAATHRAGAAAGYRKLGARWWAARLPAPTGTAAAAPGPARLLLAPAADRDRAGTVWLTGPEHAPIPLRDAKGLHYLRLLLAHPHTGISALDLSAAVNGHGPAARQKSPGHESLGHTTSGHATSGQADLGDTLDRRALAEYRTRLADLDADLAEARDWADDARTARLSAERSFLLDEIAAATGLHGRPRRQGGDAERARVAVQKAVTAALKLLTTADPTTGRLLQDTVQTGHTCTYTPDPTRPATWILDPPPPASRQITHSPPGRQAAP